MYNSTSVHKYQGPWVMYCEARGIVGTIILEIEITFQVR